MKTHLDCMPCFLRQAIDASKLAGANEALQKKVVDKVARMLPDLPLEASPPEIAEAVYGVVERLTGGEDSYKRIKQKSNKCALEIYPRLKNIVNSAGDRLLAALRLAVAGNVIDYGLPNVFDIEEEIEDCLKKDFAVFDYDDFKKVFSGAKNILYLLDNAGEVVFDKLLVEEMAAKSVVCAVREKPIINDVTLDDAKKVGLDAVATVISSGSAIPGTVISKCNKEFLECYRKADMIISKGQGNFETLASQEKPVFFIFKAKCPVVAGEVGCLVGDIILKRQQPD